MRTLKLISIASCVVFLSQKKIFAHNHTSTNESIYARARDCFASGAYAEASELLEMLKGKMGRDEEVYPYARIYHALALHRLGESAGAADILETLLAEKPDWVNKGEALYWLGLVLFEGEKHNEAFRVLLREWEGQSTGVLEDLKLYFLEKTENSSELENLFGASGKDRTFAEAVVQKINAQPIYKRNYRLVETLANEFGLQTNDCDLFAKKKSNSKRDSYRVAVLLPFHLQTLSKEQNAERDKAFSLYQGIKLSVAELVKQGVQVELYAYDIVPGSEILPELIDADEFAGMDAIIGPLSALEIGLASEFSKKFGIPIFNPLSDDISFVADNPFYFLYKPSMEAKARLAAMYTISKAGPDSKIGILYSGGEAELQAARIYKDYLEGMSEHKVALMMALNDEDASEFLNFYIKKKKKAKAAPNFSSDFPSLENISHLYVISRNELVAASVLSAAEILNNNMLLIADESWLNFESITLDRFLNLKIVFLTSNFIDYAKNNIYDYRKDFYDVFASFPNIYSITGHDLMMFLGHMLCNYGSNFIAYFPKCEIFKSKVLNDVKFGFGHDNMLAQVARIDGEGYISCFSGE